MIYQQQVELLIEALPIVMKDPRLGMKGGTALNLFHHDMPRLSVDIDITYLPIEERPETFTNIHQILREMQASLKKILQCEARSSVPLNGAKEAKLVVERGGIQIKVEPNFTIRGALFTPEPKNLSPRCSQKFQRDVTVNCLSRADLYGGKICAALDRQHPRDFVRHQSIFRNRRI